MPAQIPPRVGSAGRLQMIDMDSAPWAHDNASDNSVKYYANEDMNRY